MIVFRHGASEFKNLRLECDGTASDMASHAASVLMAAAIGAMQMRNPPRLDIQTSVNCIKIKCEYNIHTAEIAMTTISGFEWLAKQLPDEVKVERIHSKKV